MNVIKKLYCPICGKEMDADLHAVEDGAKWIDPPGIPDWSKNTEEAREIDNWICLREPEHHCVVFDRDDIKEWIK